MSIAVPKEIRDQIQQKIWQKADELNWPRITDIERSAWYENWSKEKEIGGILAHFMDPRKVRVYIKDSLLKPYLRDRLEDDAEKALLAVGLTTETGFVKTYNKPHGRILLGGQVVCWGNSRDWKSIIMSVYERTYGRQSAVAYAAILIENGKTTNEGLREMIKDVGEKLEIKNVVWVD